MIRSLYYTCQVFYLHKLISNPGSNSRKFRKFIYGYVRISMFEQIEHLASSDGITRVRRASLFHWILQTNFGKFDKDIDNKQNSNKFYLNVCSYASIKKMIVMNNNFKRTKNFPLIRQLCSILLECTFFIYRSTQRVFASTCTWKHCFFISKYLDGSTLYISANVRIYLRVCDVL